MSAATITRPATKLRAQPQAAAWPEFIRTYREHLTWLLTESEDWAEDVTDDARRSRALVVRTCTDLQKRSFRSQHSSVGAFRDLALEISEAAGAAKQDQPHEWDRLVGTAEEFSRLASGLVEAETIDLQHVNYLAALASAQANLVRVLRHTPESLAETRSELRPAAAVEAHPLERTRAAQRPSDASAGPEEAKLRQLSQILYDASQTDGANFDSGYSLRLLRIASEIALDEAAGFDRRSDQERANAAFDLAAIVGSARRVPSDLPLPAGLLALIEQARVLLSDLCDCEDCFDDGEDRAAVEPAPMLNGYTSMQLKEILDHIACSTDTAAEILMDVEGHIGGEEWTPSQCKTTLHVAAQAVRMVGAMADQASGSHLFGGPIEWSIGDRDLKGSLHA